MTAVPMHSSKNDRWFTPGHIVEAARLALGSFDLDPASEPLANTVVRAARIITAEEDGLAASWLGPLGLPVRTFINPPGGITADRRSLAGAFWCRLMRERAAGHIAHAVFVAFNLELLQSTQNSAEREGVPALGEFLVCVPRGRVRYWAPEGRKMSSPTHGSVIGYVPGTVDASLDFCRAFAGIGSIMVGVPRTSYTEEGTC